MLHTLESVVAAPLIARIGATLPCWAESNTSIVFVAMSVKNMSGDETVTCVVADIPPNDAVIVAVPAPEPGAGLASPVGDTVATVESELDHVARSVTSRVVESDSVAVAVSWVGVPSVRL